MRGSRRQKLRSDASGVFKDHRRRHVPLSVRRVGRFIKHHKRQLTAAGVTAATLAAIAFPGTRTRAMRVAARYGPTRRLVRYARNSGLPTGFRRLLTPRHLNPYTPLTTNPVVAEAFARSAAGGYRSPAPYLVRRNLLAAFNGVESPPRTPPLIPYSPGSTISLFRQRYGISPSRGHLTPAERQELIRKGRTLLMSSGRLRARKYARFN